MFKRFFKRAPPLKDALNDAIVRLTQQKRKLEILNLKIKSREKALFDSVTMAIERKDPERAKIYANELAEVKKVQKNVRKSILVLEQLVIRMETLREFGTAFAQLKPTLEVVKQVSDQLSEVMPEVSNELSNIGSVLGDALIGVNINLMQEELLIKMPNCDKIIEEAATYLSEKIENELPVPPIGVRMAVAIGGEGDEEFLVSSNGIIDPDEAVLSYLKENQGRLNIKECSRLFQIPEEEIPKIVESLSRKGLIKIMIVEGITHGVRSSK
ncbi:MAG: Snf7 family protein [Candidatus Methanomethyliaceae archaeon]|nr:Snf7 family protein [Candidatus Methanomethyliaceae archaeon]